MRIGTCGGGWAYKAGLIRAALSCADSMSMGLPLVVEWNGGGEDGGVDVVYGF